MNDDLSTITVLIGGLFLFYLWLSLLGSYGRGVNWLLERNSRIAIVAGGVLASVPAVLLLCAWRFGAGFYEPPDGTLHGPGLAMFGSIAALAWVRVAVRLRRLRPARVPEPAARPVLQKPPARPLLPRRPGVTRIEAARARIKGRV